MSRAQEKMASWKPKLSSFIDRVQHHAAATNHSLKVRDRPQLGSRGISTSLDGGNESNNFGGSNGGRWESARQWAGQKIRRGTGALIAVNADGSTSATSITEEVVLFPGWAAKRYHDVNPRSYSAQSIDRDQTPFEPFDLEIYVSGYATAQAPLTRSQRAFLRVAKRFAALPKLQASGPQSRDGTELERGYFTLNATAAELAQLQAHADAEAAALGLALSLPPRPDAITDDYGGDPFAQADHDGAPDADLVVRALDREFRASQGRDGDSESVHGSEGSETGSEPGTPGPLAYVQPAVSSTSTSFPNSRARSSTTSSIPPPQPIPLPTAADPLRPNTITKAEAERQHATLEERLRPFWARALTGRTVRICIYAIAPRPPSPPHPAPSSSHPPPIPEADTAVDPEDGLDPASSDFAHPSFETPKSTKSFASFQSHEPHHTSREEEEELLKDPLVVRTLSTASDGAFTTRLTVPWDMLCTDPAGSRLAFAQARGFEDGVELKIVAELIPAPVISKVAPPAPTNAPISAPPYVPRSVPIRTTTNTQPPPEPPAPMIGGQPVSAAKRFGPPPRHPSSRSNSGSGPGFVPPPPAGSATASSESMAGGVDVATPMLMAAAMTPAASNSTVRISTETTRAPNPAPPLTSSPSPNLLPNYFTPNQTIHAPSSSISSTPSALPPPPVQPKAARTDLCIPLHSTPLRLVSDIDDTVKRADVNLGARAIFQNVFVHELERAVLPGMGAWYRRMADAGVGVHYVSNSPFELLPLIQQFFDLSGLPTGSIRLKSYAGRTLFNGLLSAPSQRKRANVAEVLTAFPESRFVLIGDSGEQDLELYADLARERSSQPPRPTSQTQAQIQADMAHMSVDQHDQLNAEKHKADRKAEKKAEKEEKKARRRPYRGQIAAIFIRDVGGPHVPPLVDPTGSHPSSGMLHMMLPVPGSGGGTTTSPAGEAEWESGSPPKRALSDADVEQALGQMQGMQMQQPKTGRSFPLALGKLGVASRAGTGADASGPVSANGDPVIPGPSRPIYTEPPSYAPPMDSVPSDSSSSLASLSSSNTSVSSSNCTTHSGGTQTYQAWAQTPNGRRSPSLSEGERKRAELQARVYRARAMLPPGVVLRVFRHPDECIETEGLLKGAGLA